MVTLQTVEIPGFAEAQRKECRIRDTAFLGGCEIVCGVRVRPLTLRGLILLEHAGNGYMHDCRFISPNEALAHAIQVLYFCRDGFSEEKLLRFTFWNNLCEFFRNRRFIAQVTRGRAMMDTLQEIEAWVLDQLMDAPTPQVTDLPGPKYAAYPAHLLDFFAESGHRFTQAELMGMPLKQLWQHWRLAAHRLRNLPLTNPSDQLAVDHLNPPRK